MTLPRARGTQIARAQIQGRNPPSRVIAQAAHDRWMYAAKLLRG